MAPLPLITIIGVPNTGKSTLFNRLIGHKRALVHPSPGMTRDVLKRSCDINGRRCSLQDTGGFFPEDGSISITTEVNRRIFREAERSAVIVFMFDGRRELLGYEKDLFLEVRKRNRRIVVVINKIDNDRPEAVPTSYYELPADFLTISAEHNLGIEKLLEAITTLLPAGEAAGEAEPRPLRISVVGKPNVGKSSLINRLVQEDRLIVSPVPGTTRDSIEVGLTFHQQPFELVDHAGIRKLQKVQEKTEGAAILKAERDISLADLILFVLDVGRPLDQTDLFIARLVVESAKPVILALNKWDLVTEEGLAAETRVKAIQRRLTSLDFAPLVRISASSGKNVTQLLEMAHRIDALMETPWKAAKLTEILQQIARDRKCRCSDGSEFRPKFVRMESNRPFFLQIRTGSGLRLKPADEMYVKRQLAQQLGLIGIPIFFRLKGRE